MLEDNPDGKEAARPELSTFKPQRMPETAPQIAPVEPAAGSRGVILRTAPPAEPARPSGAAWESIRAADDPPRLRQAAPARELSLRIDEAGRQRVDVRVNERAGEVRIAVHTRDAGLARSLQIELPELVSRLERHGFQAEARRPPGTQEASGPPLRESRPAGDGLTWEQEGDGRQREARRDGEPGQQQRHRRPDGTPGWSFLPAAGGGEKPRT